MELWKFLILTYLSVAIIEGIPSTNILNEEEKPIYEPKSVPIATDPDSKIKASWLDRWSSRTKIPIIHQPTTIAPGSLADINLKIDAMKNQITAMNNQLTTEQNQVQQIISQIETLGISIAALGGLING